MNFENPALSPVVRNLVRPSEEMKIEQQAVQQQAIRDFPGLVGRLRDCKRRPDRLDDFDVTMLPWVPVSTADEALGHTRVWIMPAKRNHSASLVVRSAIRRIDQPSWCSTVLAYDGYGLVLNPAEHENMPGGTLPTMEEYSAIKDYFEHYIAEVDASRV